MKHSVTFRQLESQEDRELIGRSGNSPLEMWYRSVRDKPIDEFTYNDLCKACRQQLFPEAVIPTAIETLRKEPLAGELYDGELIVAMKYIGRDYWLSHPRQPLEVASIAKSVMEQVDNQMRTELAALMVSLVENKGVETKGDASAL